MNLRKDHLRVVNGWGGERERADLIELELSESEVRVNS